MNETMMIWIVVVAVVALALLFSAIERFREKYNRTEKRMHFLEIKKAKSETSAIDTMQYGYDEL